MYSLVYCWGKEWLFGNCVCSICGFLVGCILCNNCWCSWCCGWEVCCSWLYFMLSWGIYGYLLFGIVGSSVMKDWRGDWFFWCYLWGVWLLDKFVLGNWLNWLGFLNGNRLWIVWLVFVFFGLDLKFLWGFGRLYCNGWLFVWNYWYVNVNCWKGESICGSNRGFFCSWGCWVVFFFGLGSVW